jgi:hypothetical protein
VTPDSGAVRKAASAEDARRTIRRLKLALAVVIVVAVAISAYLIGANKGDDSGQEGRIVSQASTTPTETASAPCAADVDEIYRSLRALHSRIAVGVNVGEYTRLVGDAQVAFDTLETPPGPCGSALQHFEAAIGIHGDAASEWDFCIEEYPGCYVDSLGVPDKSGAGGVRIFRLYRRWERAEQEMKDGKAALPTSTP